MNILVSLSFILSAFVVSFGKISQDKVSPDVGNFALPASQQPSPLTSFGQNVVDKGDLVLYSGISVLKGHKRTFAEISPSLVYGISDDLSFLVELPITGKFEEVDPITQTKYVSHGLQDLALQLEWAFCTEETATRVNQLTFVSNLTLPTGSDQKIPSTGLGSPSFFLGVTASHAEEFWYYFTSLGSEITTSHCNSKPGDQILYQFGLSRNISYKQNNYIFNCTVELNGCYNHPDTELGRIDPNSGGNEIYLTPSLWFSTQNIVLQAGISLAVSRKLYGIQNKDRYCALVSMGWKF